MRVDLRAGDEGLRLGLRLRLGMDMANRDRVGFTLIELLTVIAIIGILAGMLMPAIFGFQTKTKIKKAEVEVKTLATAIRAYHTEYTRWPVDPAAGGVWSNNNYEVLRCLVAGVPGNGNDRNFNFFELTNTASALCDPFRSNFPYRIRIDVTGNYVRVWSLGPDCVDNGETNEPIYAAH